MLCAVALCMWAVGKPVVGPSAQGANRVVESRSDAWHLRVAPTWQPAVDLLGKQIGRTSDLNVARVRLGKAIESGRRAGIQGTNYELSGRKSVRTVGGPHPGLLAYAWADVRRKRDGGVDTAIQCLFWFERAGNHWRGQLLFAGARMRDYFEACLEPYDALTTQSRLVAIGHCVDATRISPSLAFVFAREGPKWVHIRTSSSVAESHYAYFGRVGGRKKVDRLYFKTRSRLNMIAVSAAGPRRYDLVEHRFEGGEYRYYTTKPIPSAIAALDDMIWCADNKEFASLRKRCAVPALAKKFVKLLRRVSGDHAYGATYRFENVAQVHDGDTEFELQGTRTRLTFQKGRRGWVLAYMRQVR